MKIKLLSILVAMAALVPAAGFTDQAQPAARARPNIIFILTDDLSWNLVKYMPNVQQMRKDGVTFTRYFVTDSLCCPSRASILTGQYPHNTGIFTNTGKEGGFKLFHSNGLEYSTFATRLRSVGYLTGMMGKYMNGYRPNGIVDGLTAYVPPGWDEWAVGGNAYDNYNYVLNENGELRGYGRQAEDYLTDVLADKGVEFVTRAKLENKPFLLEIATYTPHSPYPPARRHFGMLPALRAPRNAAFNESDLSDKPSWLNRRGPLRSLTISNIDLGFRKRALSLQAIDELIASLKSVLKLNGQLANTYIFFTSDNGYHMGEHRLAGGKMTAFETDIRVPLIVTGPRVARGKTITRLASNIDLYPTFSRIGGASVPASVDGRSLVPLWGKTPVARWRKAILVEHHGPDRARNDPDFQGPYAGNPPSYNALRTATATYVEYFNGEIEYYDLARDPFQLNNSPGLLSPAAREQLHNQVAAMTACKGNAACGAAAGG